MLPKNLMRIRIKHERQWHSVFFSSQQNRHKQTNYERSSFGQLLFLDPSRQSPLIPLPPSTHENVQYKGLLDMHRDWVGPKNGAIQYESAVERTLVYGAKIAPLKISEKWSVYSGTAKKLARFT